MDINQAIAIFTDFFETNYAAEVSQALSHIDISFMDIAKWDAELADLLLDEPEEIIKAAEIALEAIDTPTNLAVRVHGLPSTQKRNIWEVRRTDVGKFIALEGIISKSTAIVPVCWKAKYECYSCNAVIGVLMTGAKFTEPKGCSGCKSKGKMKLLEKEMCDTIKLGVMDDLMDNENKDRALAREAICVLSDKHGLTERDVDMMIKPGKKVIVNGTFSYVQRKEQSVEFDMVFNVNAIEFVKVGWETVVVENPKTKMIEKLAKDKDIIERLSNSIADIQGFSEIKKACLLQLAGAPNIYDENKHLSSRGTIHMLLVGNPGGGKTFLAKRAGSISPIYSFQSASTASGRGLVVSVVNDKELGTWVIHPGVVSIASKGICVIDEIDKTHKDDYGDHNNAMNDMFVVVAKANVRGKLETETSYLATANPEHRVFTQYEDFINQIDMPKDFLDRFDLILPMIAPEAKEMQDRIMDIMLERHTKKEEDKIWSPEFSHEFIQEYIAYCRVKNPTPAFAPELFPLMKEQMTALMQPKNEEQAKISFRQLECITRFAYASARLHLRDVTEEDIKLAFDLKRKSFEDLGIIDKSGAYRWNVEESVDVGKISSDKVIRDALKTLLPDKDEMCSMMDLVELCEKEGVSEDIVEDYIQKLKFKSGEIFEPRTGFLKRL